ncbi:MAG: hypothetical protein FJ263_11415 [Planctomycetes bacterium]|nr:hypothetical protein [Planctomycetota bacterium]
MSEAAKIAIVKEYWKHADEGLRDEFARMQKGFAFYVGDQWDAADLEKLYVEKRPALTINLILPIINLICGIQRQGRQDITVVARKGGLITLAAVFTQILRHCMDMTDADYETADCFLDGVIGNKGWLNLGVDFTEDPVFGDLAVCKVSPFDMREDPDAKEYDLNKSGKFVIKDSWMDKEALLLNFPEKESDLSNGGLELNPASDDVTGDAERGKLRWRVRECWHKTFEKRIILINTATGTMKTIRQESLDLAKAVVGAAKGKWVLKDWVVPVLNKTVTAGNLVLEDIIDPYHGVTSFPYYRFCPYWVDGYVMGVVQNLFGPQQELNKRRSQALHNLNQTANSGFKVKKVLNNYDRHLAKFGSTPGVVLDESKAGGKIERIEPAPLSEGHLTASQISADDMKEISGANFDLLGQMVEGHNESGKAIELRQSQGMKVVEVVFDNFARTQKLLALGIVDMVRYTDVYSNQEIIAIIAEQNESIDMNLLKDRKIGRYGIKVASSSSSPTARYAKFMSIMEIAKMYPEQIGPEVLIENSDMANKEEILQKVKPAAQVQEPKKPKPQSKAEKLKFSRDYVNIIS